MFCIHCGTSLPDGARFCSSCGTSLASGAAFPTTAAAATSPHPTHQAQPPTAFGPQSSHQYHHHTPSSPTATPVYAPAPAPFSPPHGHYASPPPTPANYASNSTAMFSANGYPQPAFETVAAALFHALNQNIAPQGTGALEIAKMQAFRTLGGLSVPPYFAEWVMPTYIQVIGIDTIPGQTPPVVSWNGWHTFLIHKIKNEPDASFVQITRVAAALRVQLSITRADFPVLPDPAAQAKEQLFKTQVYSPLRKGTFGAGALGSGLGLAGGLALGSGASGLGGGSSSGSGGNGKLEAATAIAKLAAQGGMNIMNASSGGTTGTWFMPGTY